MLVLFDSCWDAHPSLGPQPSPISGVHNSRWVQSPGAAALADPRERRRLEAYVRGVIGRFANDPRILAWDVWNEPDNLNGLDYFGGPVSTALVLELLPKVFAWARAAHPRQPLTSALWNGEWSDDSSLRPIEKLQLTNSDVITFHNYEAPAAFDARARQLERFGRPLICTEYMARPTGSTFQGILPLARAHRTGAINWGLFAGKTQTYFPWSSWEHPDPTEPRPWFHDVFRAQGTPYDFAETDFIREITR